MSSSYSVSGTETFTATHAKYMASKVATDLKRLQRLYPEGGLSDADIAAYEAEATELLKAGCLGTVSYGFWREGKWIEPSLHYSASDLQGASASDDDPGKIRPGADTSGAIFWSYLTYSSAWGRLSQAEREQVLGRFSIRRSGAPEPGVEGYLVQDRTYSAGGRSMSRSSVRSY